MFKTLFVISVLSCVLFTGCGKNLSPFNPELKQQLNNSQGQIEELKNNQNGIQLEMGKIRSQSEINARDIHDAQQGILNIKGSQNSGIQLFSGDGGTVMFIALLATAILFIYHYRDKAIKAEKTAQILAQSVAMYNDKELIDKVHLAALNTSVENDVYHLMLKNQSMTSH